MNTLETEICNHMLEHGIFDTMIRYKKDAQQLGVIFKRIHGMYLTQYCTEHNIKTPKTKRTWQEKAQLLSETFNQQIVEYTEVRRTKNPLTLKCLECGKEYQKSWDQFNSGQVCSCVKSFQRTVVGTEYYVGQFLKNNWELTNSEDFVNSHSVLTLRHTCGQTRTAMAKTLRTQTGICSCQQYSKKRVEPTHKKVDSVIPPHIRETLIKWGMPSSQIGTLRKRVKRIDGVVSEVSPTELRVETPNGEVTMAIFTSRGNPMVRKMYDHGLTANQVKYLMAKTKKYGYTIIDVTKEDIIEQHECGQIYKHSRKTNVHYYPVCPCRMDKQFHEDLKAYPLQQSFDERWTLVEYTGKCQPITIKCKKCEHIRTLNNLHRFQYHVRCGCEDTISYGERMIFNLLNHNKIPFERQYILDNKRFDFYLPDSNLLLEYDGIQHVMDVPWWGTTRESQQANDALKDDIAQSHKHKLIRFSHEDGIDDIIRKLSPYVQLEKRKGFDYNKPVKLLPDEVLDDYVHMTYQQLRQKYKGLGLSLSLVRLNREFKSKYGATKTDYRRQAGMNSPFTRPKKKRKKD